MRVLTAGLMLMFAASASQADIFEPFSTSNLNPFVQVHGLPTAAPAEINTKGDLAVGLQTDYSNNFTRHTRTSEAILIDGETHRATLSLKYGIAENWELGIDIPWVRHDGGSLDGFIENWHDIWGLPNGGREKFVDDALTFRYQKNGVNQINLVRSASGLGDIRLSAGYKLKASAHRTLSLRGGVKLDTGDADKLTGSGGTDLYASLHLSDTHLFNHPDWHFHGNLGILAPGDSDLLPNQLEDWVVFGSSTIAWGAFDKVSLKAQLDFHSAFYDSDLKELGKFSTQLVLGGSIELGQRMMLDLSVAEDILTDTSPDVVFQLGLRSTF